MNLVKVQYRRVHNDANVSEWRDWPDLGTFESLDHAIAAVSLEFRGCALQDVSFDQIGIYEPIDYHPRWWQMRFQPTKDRLPRTLSERESPWKVGLNEA